MQLIFAVVFYYGLYSTLCISGEDSSNLIIQMHYGFLITQPAVLFVQDYGDVILIVLLVFHYAVDGGIVYVGLERHRINYTIDLWLSSWWQ